MHSRMQDLRFAFRVLRKSPLSSTVIVATLALGIAANTVMFSSFSAWVLRPLDFEDPEALVAVHEAVPGRGESGYGASAANLRDWQAESASLAEISAYRRTVFNFHDQDDPERVHGARVMATLFPLLGVDPVIGRHFSPADDLPNGPAVALVSHETWRRRFDGDAGVLGRTFRLDGVVHEVVGVMPPGFEFPEWAHVWTPLALDPVAEDRSYRHLETLARLAPGSSREEAGAEMRLIGERLAARYPETNAGWSVDVVPLREEWAPPIIRLALLVSVAAAAFVLLVICANVANLMLAQAISRRREVALRSALGASRGRLVAQTVTEGVLLGLAGGALGAVLGTWGMDWMKSWVPVKVPYLFRFEVDAQALLYTLGISVAAGLVCALAPVVRSTGTDVAAALQDGGRTTGGRGSQRLRSALVAAEFAVSVLLVAGALLMAMSFLREQRIQPGYRMDGVLTARLSLTGTAYEEEHRRVAFLEDAVARVAALAGVESAGAADRLPVSTEGSLRVELEAEGRPFEPGEEPRAALHAVTPGYLESLGIPVVEGRAFTAEEAEGALDVAVLSRGLADRMWPDGSAVGRRVRFAGDDTPWLRVVGVLADVDPGHSMVVRAMPRVQLYVPFAQEPAESVTLVVRSDSPLALLGPAVREELRRLDAGVPVSSLQTLHQAVDEVHWVSRVFSKLFTIYAAIALLIAALGAYGVTADSVSRRRREMAVRTTLGARPVDLVRLVVAKGLAPGVLGVALGLAAALPVTRLMSSMLYQVDANDPLVFGAVALVLVSVALTAAYLPARRVSRVEPMEVLRFE